MDGGISLIHKIIPTMKKLNYENPEVSVLTNDNLQNPTNLKNILRIHIFKKIEAIAIPQQKLMIDQHELHSKWRIFTYTANLAHNDKTPSYPKTKILE